MSFEDCVIVCIDKKCPKHESLNKLLLRRHSKLFFEIFHVPVVIEIVLTDELIVYVSPPYLNIKNTLNQLHVTKNFSNNNVTSSSKVFSFMEYSCYSNQNTWIYSDTLWFGDNNAGDTKSLKVFTFHYNSIIKSKTLEDLVTLWHVIKASKVWRFSYSLDTLKLANMWRFGSLNPQTYRHYQIHFIFSKPNTLEFQ